MNILEELYILKDDIKNETILELINILIFIEINIDDIKKYSENIYILNIDEYYFFEIINNDINYIILKNGKIEKRIKLFKHHKKELTLDITLDLISQLYITIINNIDLKYKNTESIRKKCSKLNVNELDNIKIIFLDNTIIEKYHYIDDSDFDFYLDEQKYRIDKIIINTIEYKRNEIYTDEFQKEELETLYKEENYEMLELIKKNNLNKFIELCKIISKYNKL
jgi:hypothetical protein